MSKLTWEEIRDSASALAHKVSKKADALADSAALRVRLTARQRKLEEEYTRLGELTYLGMTEADGDDETVARRIHEAVERVTALRQEIDSLEGRLHTR